MNKQHYRAWLDSALDELNAHFGEGTHTGHRLYHQESVPEDYEPGELVEFAEDGDAYPHGRGGTGHIRRAVTPWAEYEQNIKHDV
ncbi:MAG: hypothetical protein MN733_23985 [Nitrososphaera sp.]|nr:hypothetical protein [Nitrososphaera sp.]